MHAAIDTAVLHGIVAKVLHGTVTITSVHTDTAVLHSIVATVLHGTVATSVPAAIDTAMQQLYQCCTSL